VSIHQRANRTLKQTVRPAFNQETTDTNQGTIDPASSVRRFGGSTFYTHQSDAVTPFMWSCLLASFALKACQFAIGLAAK
jgi:hypothetical protein